jgi:hypothetical protein
MYEAMWLEITHQTGGKITVVTIPVMFGRCALKIISIPICMDVDYINFNVTSTGLLRFLKVVAVWQGLTSSIYVAAQ